MAFEIYPATCSIDGVPSVVIIGRLKYYDFIFGGPDNSIFRADNMDAQLTRLVQILNMWARKQAEVNAKQLSNKLIAQAKSNCKIFKIPDDNMWGIKVFLGSNNQSGANFALIETVNKQGLALKGFKYKKTALTHAAEILECSLPPDAYIDWSKINEEELIA